MRLVLLVVTLLSGMLSVMDDPDAAAKAHAKKLEAFAVDCEGWRRGLILDEEAELKDKKNSIKRQKANRNTDSETRADNLGRWEARSKVLEENIKRWRSGAEISIPLLPTDLEVGSIGRIVGPVKILQVVDDSNALLIGNIGASRTHAPGASATPDWKTQSLTVWIEDYSTEGLVDDKAVVMSDVYEVVGTKKYTAVSGSTNTIYRIRKFDHTGLEEEIKKTFPGQYPREADQPKAKSPVKRAKK